jgi:hypothetical protein
VVETLVFVPVDVGGELTEEDFSIPKISFEVNVEPDSLGKSDRCNSEKIIMIKQFKCSLSNQFRWCKGTPKDCEYHSN